jgi:hypothetical protein
VFDLALCCGPNAHNSVQPLGSYGVVHNTRTYTQRMASDGEQREVNLPNRWHRLWMCHLRKQHALFAVHSVAHGSQLYKAKGLIQTSSKHTLESCIMTSDFMENPYQHLFFGWKNSHISVKSIKHMNEEKWRHKLLLYDIKGLTLGYL